MTGWVAPGAPGPVVGWQQPVEPEGLGVRESLSESWRITRAHLGPLATIAVLPEVLRNLLLLPLWLTYGAMFSRQIDFFVHLDYTRYASDPAGVQREMEAILRISPDQAIAIAISGGASIIVGLIGFGAITAGTLSAAAGQRPTVAGAWRSVAAHLGSLVIPAIALGLAWMVIGVPLTLVSNTASSGSFNAGASLVGGLLTMAIFAIAVVAVFLVVRWAVIFQVVLSDDRGLWASLRESARLTAGARTRIGLVLIAQWVILGIIVSLIALATGLVAGLLTWSVQVGAVGYMVGLMICGFVYMPWVAAMLTHIHTVQTGASSAPIPEPSA